jgi:hypothetical protein
MDFPPTRGANISLNLRQKNKNLNRKEKLL